ncbi:hypothetical protein LTR56_016493 [Elasticomyces elasticus]|nr:hypothetical protein LTR22_025965 [Elasticomyces elasticus]KAK3632125.1 hypothetical protein LTR56_016493 [Elasticomyces elasticus]KAK4923733.1 hypothetical protein LTR49_009090 [Elasticomyces elasticus]KAK5757538.1 hypothetical protein LTS12_012357 [Elasticomyces elasticus]
MAATSNAAITDSYGIIRRSLEWDGSTQGLDELCDHIVEAAEILHERDAVRIATSLLIVNHKRLPSLQDAVCEFALACVLHNDRDAWVHLRHASETLRGLERNADWLGAYYGLADQRVPALRVRIDQLFATLEEKAAASRAQNESGLGPGPGRIDMAVRSTPLDERGVHRDRAAMAPSFDTPRPALPPLPASAFAFVHSPAPRPRTANQRDAIDLTMEDDTERPAKRKREDKSTAALKQPAPPVHQAITRREPVFEEVVQSTETEIRQAAASPAKRTGSSTMRPKPQLETVTNPSQSPSMVDSVPISSFYTSSCCFVNDGTLTYDPTLKTLAVTDASVTAHSSDGTTLGGGEMKKVFSNPNSNQVYMTGAVTKVSIGHICITFKDYDGVEWLIERLPAVTANGVLFHIMATDRLDAIFVKQSAVSRTVFERRSAAQRQASTTAAIDDAEIEKLSIKGERV